ncbi:MAG: AAA family ATPase, partial [Lachnospiraceae bacterium]|nr:AAA family ATPase [Lachnospiraceae bacterium]
MVELQGYIDRIVFRNEENGYSVLCMKEGNKEEFLVGVFPDVSEGEYLTARGEMNVHPIYGKQLRVQEYEFTAPSDAASTLKYLSSGAIKGIGEALATRIVKKFGDDTFRIMEEEPERLAEVKGISMRKALEISGAVAGKRDLRQAMLFLQQYGITQNLGMKIYNFYQGRLYQVIRENPYKLADDIDGVGFRIADEIASKAGILPDSDFRIRSGILYVLEQATGQGHTCLPMDQLMQEARRLLGVEIDSMNDRIMDLIMDKKIVVKTKEDIQMVYSSVSYYTELTIAQMLKDLNIKDTITSDEIAAKIKAIETEQDIALDERQRLAVSEAVNNGLTIITGGPGTGKTTTIRTIIRYFEKEGLDILLAAPTGRAAKRMKEATGCEAKTVHRLLELSGMVGEGATSFGRNEDNPLETDVVIIDEVSMVDIFLMKSLLRALVPGMRLILVGDVNQLPSVGPGNVLRD